MSAKLGVWSCRPGPAAIFVLLLCWKLASASGEEARFFRIGAAATSGTFFEIGAVIAGAISKSADSPPCGHGGNCGVPGLVAVTQATQGSVENLLMIADGQIESGIAQSDIAGWAYAGTGVFASKGPMASLRAIASLFPESLQLVVRDDSPIRTVADLKGKHISLGQVGSGTLADARIVLAAVGLTEQDVDAEYLRPSVATANIIDGSLDGFFLIGGAPVPAIHELALAVPIRMVPLSDHVLAKMRQSSRSYRRSIIAAGTYPGIEVDTPSIGFNALWVVSADASDDLIYEITRALWNEATQHLLETHNAMGKQVRFNKALDGLSVPLHTGAARFYREAGLPVDDEGAVGKRD